jgi:hypothetical protein
MTVRQVTRASLASSIPGILGKLIPVPLCTARSIPGPEMVCCQQRGWIANGPMALSTEHPPAALRSAPMPSPEGDLTARRAQPRGRAAAHPEGSPFPFSRGLSAAIARFRRDLRLHIQPAGWSTVRCDGMAKAARVLAALKRAGWTESRRPGSHRVLVKGHEQRIWAYHDGLTSAARRWPGSPGTTGTPLLNCGSYRTIFP